MIIDGKKIADRLVEELSVKVKALAGRPPHLKVVLVGNHPPSLTYIKRKVMATAKAGILSEVIHLEETISEKSLLDLIGKLNQDTQVDGILIQLPLPLHISPKKIISKVSPSKDVDGFHPLNLGKLLAGETEGFISCTPLGVQRLLIESGVNVAGKNVLIIGRSNIVGKPLAALLMQNAPGGNATVTLAHSKTVNLKEYTLTADILIAAMGQAKAITGEMIKPGAVVIDVGINLFEGKLVGDVDFESTFPKASLITPVPGGVGPMTIAMLLENTFKARLFQKTI